MLLYELKLSCNTFSSTLPSTFANLDTLHFYSLATLDPPMDPFQISSATKREWP